VASKLDRLSRSLLDFAGMMERARRRGWAMVVLDANVDTTIPMGEAMAGMVAVFAQLERRRIGERTREALAVRRAQGVRLGRPPTVPPEPEDQAGARPGATLQAIADRLNADGVATAQGGRRWWPSTVSGLAG
jgi:DNA invertase Pin-like site-specific DNA recombinase